MTPRLKTGVLAGTIALLGIAAIAGWTREPRMPVASASDLTSPTVYGNTAASAPNSYPNSYANNTNAAQNPHPPDQYSKSSAPAYTSAYPETQPPTQNCVEPAQYQTATYAPAYSGGVVYRNRPRYVRQYVERTTYVPNRRYVYHRGRSTKKSALIVLGSAGTGAAIGALAGGGTGAGIGALSGGATGFGYDRLTHNHVN